jgi:hypothetical protein
VLRYAPEPFKAGEANLYKDGTEEDLLYYTIEGSANEANTSKIWS